MVNLYRRVKAFYSRYKIFSCIHNFLCEVEFARTYDRKVRRDRDGRTSLATGHTENKLRTLMYEWSIVRQEEPIFFVEFITRRRSIRGLL